MLYISAVLSRELPLKYHNIINDWRSVTTIVCHSVILLHAANRSSCGKFIARAIEVVAKLHLIGRNDCVALVHRHDHEFAILGHLGSVEERHGGGATAVSLECLCDRLVVHKQNQDAHHVS